MRSNTGASGTPNCRERRTPEVPASTEEVRPKETEAGLLCSRCKFCSSQLGSQFSCSFMIQAMQAKTGKRQVDWEVQDGCSEADLGAC